MYKNKTAVFAIIVAVFAITSVASAGLTTSAGVDSKAVSISTPIISTSNKPSVGVFSTGVTTQTTPTTDATIARRAFISADYVTPGTFNSAAGSGGDYGFPGNIFLVPTDNASSVPSGVIYKGANRFIHDFALLGTDGYNTFVGVNSGNFTMTGSVFSQGSRNTAIGNRSLTSNTTGRDNVANGFESLYSNTIGPNNTAVGGQSLYSNTAGDSNTAIGNYSLYSNTTGGSNSAIGANSMGFNTTGSNNATIGMYSLFSNTTGGYNTAIGSASLRDNTTGIKNTAIGMNSGYYSNVALSTMTSSTFLGYGANSSANAINNSTAIGAGAQVTKSNQVVIGNAGVTETLLRGKVIAGNRICIWNGASYTSMSFAPNSIVPVYATSTSC